MADAEGLLWHVLPFVVLLDVESFRVGEVAEDHGTITVPVMLLIELINVLLGVLAVDGLPDDVFEVAGPLDPSQESLVGVLELLDLRLEVALEDGEPEQSLVIEDVVEAVGLHDLVILDHDVLPAVLLDGALELVLVSGPELNVSQRQMSVMLGESEQRERLLFLAGGFLYFFSVSFLLFSSGGWPGWHGGRLLFLFGSEGAGG